ncbi:Os04g0562500, partial [Oryza sativa Japonica Group]
RPVRAPCKASTHGAVNVPEQERAALTGALVRVGVAKPKPVVYNHTRTTYSSLDTASLPAVARSQVILQDQYTLHIPLPPFKTGLRFPKSPTRHGQEKRAEAYATPATPLGENRDGRVPPHHLIPGAQARRLRDRRDREGQAGCRVPRPLGQPPLPLPPAGGAARRRRRGAAPGDRPVSSRRAVRVVRLGGGVAGREGARVALGAAAPPAGAGAAAQARAVHVRGAAARRLPPPRRRARQLPGGAGRALRAPGRDARRAPARRSRAAGVRGARAATSRARPAPPRRRRSRRAIAAAVADATIAVASGSAAVFSGLSSLSNSAAAARVEVASTPCWVTAPARLTASSDEPSTSHHRIWWVADLVRWMSRAKRRSAKKQNDGGGDDGESSTVQLRSESRMKPEEKARRAAFERHENLERCIASVDSSGEKVFRALVNTRVSLLNILSPSF